MADCCWTIRIHRKKALIAAGVFLALVCLLFFTRHLLVGWLAGWLTVQDGAQACDIVFVHGGKAERRVPYGAELFKKGYGKKIVITIGRDDQWVTDFSREYGIDKFDVMVVKAILKNRDIPPSSSVLLMDSLSTRDDARKLREYYDRTPFRDALVVTDSIHSRRSMLCLHRAFKGTGVKFYSHPLVLEEQLGKFSDSDDYVNYVIEEELRLLFYTFGFKKGR
ncbi:MAG: YdcF family protein [Candidatus Eremiobacteraeota bacterium]|nr:YdcF family protein [Candidatus Eremiobacteraeota bacterium]